MAKHPTARRVHREQHDEDAFISTVLEGSVWAKTHGRIIIFAGIALLLGVAGLLYYRNHRAAVNEMAAAQLGAVRQTVMSGNRQLAMQDLRNYVNRFGDTPSGDEARTMLAQAYLDAGQAQQAIQTIRPLADDVDGPNGSSGALLLAAGYEAGKALDRAEEVYLRIAEDARFGFEKREALERAATLRLQRGDAPGAIQLFERAMNTLPQDNPERTVYEMRIAEIVASGARRAS